MGIELKQPKFFLVDTPTCPWINVFMGKLNDKQIRILKHGSKPRKVFDGEGLYLLITKIGKLWRYKYRFNKKEKVLALGAYPAVSLLEARKKHQEARKQLHDGLDPGHLKKIQKHTEHLESQNTFEQLAWEWFDIRQWSDGHRVKQKGRLNNDIIPYLGNRPIKKITAGEILIVCRRLESRGVIDGAHRVRSIISQIFNFAIAKGNADRDPARDLRSALNPYKRKHMPAITEPEEVGKLLRAIDGFSGNEIIKAALKLTPLVFVRPGELRHVEKHEINLEKALWRIPAEKMKMKRLHLVPLSKQAIKIIEGVWDLNHGSFYLFPGIKDKKKPMGATAVNKALRELGYSKQEMTGHGFRSTASTLLHEMGWNTDHIEMQLSHKDKRSMRGVYNHAKYLSQRIEMMQFWADYLDQLKKHGRASSTFFDNLPSNIRENIF